MACHKLSANLFPFAEQAINAHISHGQTRIDPSKKLKQVDNVGPLLIKALAKLRNLFIK